MKNYRLIILFLGLTFTMVSCEDYLNSAEVSRITNLPKIEVNGESSVVMGCNETSYTDEGAVATEGGGEITHQSKVTSYYFGGIDVNGSDIYEISYSAYNKDDIPGAAFRSVLWKECNGDLVNSIGGMYLAGVVRNGTTGPDYQDLGPFFIVDLGGGKYQLSDAIGGYYDHGRGYGFHYAGVGMVITANDIPANDFTHAGVIGVGAFGGDLNMTSFSVDARAKTIMFTTEWSFGYVFEVTLTQVAL